MSRTDNLIVGLGNPGAEYVDTRHNIGFQVVDALLEYFERQANYKVKWNALYSSTSYAQSKIHFLKPQTYMNRSGQPVAQFSTFYKIFPENLIIIHDDLDMPPGRVKLVRGGGSGGHNGIKSIASSLGSTEFYRLKVGIGRPGQGAVHKDYPVDKYVLSGFTKDELLMLSERYNYIVDGIKYLLDDDIGRAKGILNSLK